MKCKYEASKRRYALRERAVEFLGGACTLCGYDTCQAALDFHHTDPAEKDFTISAKMTSWAAIERELKKCVLVCARCHREIHDGRHPKYLALQDAGRSDYDWDLTGT